MLSQNQLFVLYRILRKEYTACFLGVHGPGFRIVDMSEYAEASRAVRTTPNGTGLANKIRAVAQFFYQYLLNLLRQRTGLRHERVGLVRQYNALCRRSRDGRANYPRRLDAIDQELEELALAIPQVARDYLILLSLAQLLSAEEESLWRLRTSEAKQELEFNELGSSSEEIQAILSSSGVAQ